MAALANMTVFASKAPNHSTLSFEFQHGGRDADLPGRRPAEHDGAGLRVDSDRAGAALARRAGRRARPAARRRSGRAGAHQ